MNEILADIDDTALEATGMENAGNKILANIKSTMSDRSATQKAFNELLATYRTVILPTVFANWEQLPLTQKETMSRMYNFFSGLHFLVAVADHTAEALRLFEVAHCDSSPDQAEASTVRFVRTACKALQNGGNLKLT